MTDMNISNNILMYRKAIGYTQTDLAEFLNISKAAVSKWEQGHSIPDINYLAELSVLFDVTIDELVGFSPKLSKSQIRKIYNDLAAAFGNESYDEVLGRIRNYSKQYYSSYPFLTALTGLLINHLKKAKDPFESIELAETFVERVLTYSDSLYLKERMVFYKAMILIIKEQPEEVSVLLKEFTLPKLPLSSLLAQSYIMTGNIEKAKSTLQVQIYEAIIFILNDLTMLIHFGLYEDIEELIKRGSGLDAAFDMKTLHPNSTLNFYLACAMEQTHDKEQCMYYLNEFLQCVKNLTNEYYLHGDTFFSNIDDWLAELDTGKDAPVNIGFAKEQLIDAVENNDVFKEYENNISFKSFLHNLKTTLEVE